MPLTFAPGSSLAQPWPCLCVRVSSPAQWLLGHTVTVELVAIQIRERELLQRGSSGMFAAFPCVCSPGSSACVPPCSRAQAALGCEMGIPSHRQLLSTCRSAAQLALLESVA